MRSATFACFLGWLLCACSLVNTLDDDVKTDDAGIASAPVRDASQGPAGSGASGAKGGAGTKSPSISPPGPQSVPPMDAGGDQRIEAPSGDPVTQPTGDPMGDPIAHDPSPPASHPGKPDALVDAGDASVGAGDTGVDSATDAGDAGMDAGDAGFDAGIDPGAGCEDEDGGVCCGPKLRCSEPAECLEQTGAYRCACPGDLADLRGDGSQCVDRFVGVSRFGGPGVNLGSGAGTDSDGNLFLSGAFDSSIRFGNLSKLDTAGSFDVFVAKLDGNRLPIWSRRFGATGDDRGFRMAVDGSDNVVVVGSAYGEVAFDAFTVGRPDRAGSFVAKLSGVDGSVLWVRALPAANRYWEMEGWAQDVTVASSGELYVTGRFAGVFDFGTRDGDVIAAGVADAYVVKYAANGSPLWVDTLASQVDTAGGLSLAVDSRGAVVVTGIVNSVTDLERGPPSGYGGVDAFLMKLDAGGHREWSVRLGGPQHDSGLAVAIAPNDDVFATGFFHKSLTWDDEALTGSDDRSIYLARVTSTGELIWLKGLNSRDAYSRASAIAPLADGLVLTGMFGSTLPFENGTTLRSEGMSDIFIARFLDDGSAQWARSFGGQYSDEGQDVVVVNGELVVTGWFAGTVNFGKIPMSSAGSFGVPLIRLRP